MNRNPHSTYVRRVSIFFALMLVGFLLRPAANAAKNEPANTPTTSKQRAAEAYGNLPLSFETNTGQTSREVKFLSRGPGFTLFLTKDAEAVLRLNAARTQQTRGSKADATAVSGEQPASTTASVFRLKLVNAQANPESEALEQLSGRANYFIGNDPTKWRTNVPIYAKVNFHGVYPGVDLAYYGNPQRLEYDFIVAPNGDPHAIAMAVDGAEMSVDPPGNLLLKTTGGEIAFEKPVAYQMVNGNRREIMSRYLLKSAHRIAFQVAAYDRSRPLIIDPVLSYSTYLGGNAPVGVTGDLSSDIAVDSAGNAYVTGETGSSNFPTTSGAFQTTGPPACNPIYSRCTAVDVFVTKLSADGSALVYSTYLGGNNENDGRAIAVDSTGNAYVTGRTNAGDFPTTPGAFQLALRSVGGYNAFVTKLSADGSGLMYSTYLGGSGGHLDLQFLQSEGGDQALAITVDASGNAYVTGTANSRDFPTTAGVFQPTSHASDQVNGSTGFVTKLGPDGSSLIYSTYLGGSGGSVGDGDQGNGIALDSTGNAYVAGFTGSSDFPTTPGAFQSIAPIPVGSVCSDGKGDGFASKLNGTGTGLVYSTYLGGGDFDWADSIAVDSSGNAYVAGYTFSLNFPTTPGAFQFLPPLKNSCSAGSGFVTKLNSTGSVPIYSTYISGSADDSVGSIKLDSPGDAFVTGRTFSLDYPVTANAIQPTAAVCSYGCTQAIVTVLNPLGTALVYSSYLGGDGSNGGIGFNGGIGLALGPSFNVYVTGQTMSASFPTTTGAFQSSNPQRPGQWTAFVTKVAGITAPPPLVP